jgi:competence ComEA-like helix-hairpin-helix protein
MSLTSDHKALVFLGAIAVLGAGMRLARAAKHDVSPDAPRAAALERQLAAADSAAKAGRRSAAGKKKSAGPRRGGEGANPALEPSAGGSPPSPGRSLDLAAPGYWLGKLDLDAATAVQIDSLPGLGPALARRIVAYREAHGPFQSKEGLLRVPGIRQKVLSQLESLVTFSGTLRPVSAPPESVSARPSRRRRSSAERARKRGEYLDSRFLLDGSTSRRQLR